MQRPLAFPSKTARTLLWFCLIALALYLAPGLLGFSQGEAGLLATVESLFAGHDDQAAPALPAVLAGSPSSPQPATPRRPARRAAATTVAEHPVDDPDAALTAFYESLAQTEGTTAGHTQLTRVMHYGDSMLTGDSISGAARRALQKRFGNGGHGFMLAGRPWPWYHHQGALNWSSAGFRVNRITSNPLPDGLFGLGGVTFRTFQGGSRFFAQTLEDERVSRFELYYRAHPKGGNLALRVDNGEPERLSTKAPRSEDRYHTTEVPDGHHRFTVSYAGDGEVRVYGVVLEREGPGVVLDSLGINGLHASNFSRYNADHLAAQVAHRAPNLIVVMLGTNESQNRYLNMDQHGEDYAALLTLLRAGAPQASCMVVSPPDRALRLRRNGPSLIARIVERQRAVAHAQGCAFWNTFEAMGGEGSAREWRRQTPPLLGGDYTHPTPAGAEILGTQLAEALIAGYEQYRQRQPGPAE